MCVTMDVGRGNEQVSKIVIQIVTQIDASTRGFRIGRSRRGVLFALAAALGLACGVPSVASLAAQRRAMDVPDTAAAEAAPRRTHLILKDGSYQLVLSYKVTGSVVRYRSAERDGAAEDIPLALVDLPATERWKAEHDPLLKAQQAAQPPVLSPELQREEADRAARTPEVAPDLRLPEEDSLLALDTFRATPELVPLPQQGTDLNRETAHGALKLAINPASSPHRLLDLNGPRSDIQLHVADPVFYVRVGREDEDQPATGGGLTVDTHGAAGRATPSGGDPRSRYVIERLDPRFDLRVVESFRLADLGGGRAQPGVIETHADLLPGGHWLKLTPTVPLEFGEYALIEVLDARNVNSFLWDFGIHPTAPENAEALQPEARRPIRLERRRP